MNVKQKLLQLYKLDCLIKEHIEQVEQLRLLAQKSTNTLSREPKAQMQGDRLCSLVVKIVSLQAKLNEEIDAFVDFKQFILKQIAQLECTRQKTVLMARYINFKSWPQIGMLLDCDQRNAYRIHDKAIKQLEKKEQKNENTRKKRE